MMVQGSMLNCFSLVYIGDTVQHVYKRLQFYLHYSMYILQPYLVVPSYFLTVSFLFLGTIT